MSSHFHRKLFRMPEARVRSAMPWEGLEALDRELMRLGRGVGAMRLRLAEAMQALFEANGHRELGFSSFGAWAVERIERRGRWADDSRAVARGLAELPAIRAALMAGQLSWSTAELLAQSGNLGTEDELLVLGETLTVRQLRQELAHRRQARREEARSSAGTSSAGTTTPKPDDEATPPPIDIPGVTESPTQNWLYDEPADRSALALSVERSHAWAFETVKHLLDRVDGTRAMDCVVEAMLAEAMVAMMPHVDATGGTMPTGDDLAREWREQLDQWRREAVEECEARIPREDPEPLEWDDAPLPDGSLALDAHCAALARGLAERDLVLGQLALRLFDGDGWRKLGYAEESQYCHERLGLSWSSVKRRMTLARRTLQARRVAEALEAGEIGFEAACLLARVANADNAGAWIDRATRRTVEDLREEIDCVETVARVNGRRARRGRLDPPDEATLNAWFEAERRIKSGAVFGVGQMSGGPQSDASQMSGGPTLEAIIAALGPDALASQMSGGRDGDTDADEPLATLLRRGAGRVELRLNLREDLLRWWRALEQVHRRAGLPGPFIAFLVAELWRVWGPQLPSDDKWAHIYARDRWRCRCPTCGRRDVTPHHLEFQSHGGGDEDDNLVSLCAECHLFGVHEGRLSVSPPASDMVWRLGRTPILEIRGRERIRL